MRETKKLEEEQVEQMEQTEGDGENDARQPAGANDGGAEGFGIRVMKQNPKQDEEELQQHDLQENRLSRSATSDGGINGTPEIPASEGLDDTQGHVNRSGTPAVTISSSYVASTPEQGTERETEPGQVTSNNGAEVRTNTTKEQREHSNVTTQRKVDTAGAQSNQVRGFYDEDEIVVANALQGPEISQPNNSRYLRFG
jgi:hypothetical protein